MSFFSFLFSFLVVDFLGGMDNEPNRILQAKSYYYVSYRKYIYVFFLTCLRTW